MKEVELDTVIKIGVVIVAYSSAKELSDCIEGVLFDGHVSQVVVVDNSSDTASRTIVGAWRDVDERVTYLDPKDNVGFARGCNLGAAALRDISHVFFVNPDVRLSRPLSMLALALEDSDEAIIAGRLRSPTNPTSVNARPLVTRLLELKKSFFFYFFFFLKVLLACISTGTVMNEINTNPQKKFCFIV